MILLLSDVHCRYDMVDQQLAHAETELGIPVSDVLILGDFGLFEPFMKRFFRKSARTFARPTHFIEGNHEDFDHFDHLVRKYSDILTHLPRSTVHAIAGTRMLALGGVRYMDAHTTPQGAEILPRDIERCLALPEDSADMVISHDCPAGIGVPNQPGFEHYGPTGFADATAVIAHFRPRLWVFGHHHRWFDKTIDGTRFFGLPQSWLGYALLGSDGDLHRVDHLLPKKPPRASIWRWFRRPPTQP
jgi:predicted phosphodiesterase